MIAFARECISRACLRVVGEFSIRVLRANCGVRLPPGDGRSVASAGASAADVPIPVRVAGPWRTCIRARVTCVWAGCRKMPSEVCCGETSEGLALGEEGTYAVRRRSLVWRSHDVPPSPPVRAAAWTNGQRHERQHDSRCLQCCALPVCRRFSHHAFRALSAHSTLCLSQRERARAVAAEEQARAAAAEQAAQKEALRLQRVEAAKKKREVTASGARQEERDRAAAEFACELFCCVRAG